jgi:hypothetical protein
MMIIPLGFFKGTSLDAEDKMHRIRQNNGQEIEKFMETAPGNSENFFPS